MLHSRKQPPQAQQSTRQPPFSNLAPLPPAVPRKFLAMNNGPTVHGIRLSDAVVEVFRPAPNNHNDFPPLILIHGDFHNRKIWKQKPDGGQGWAFYFVELGYRVFMIDLPGSGDSPPFLHYDGVSRLHPSIVEKELTCPTIRHELNSVKTPCSWRSWVYHDKWPGTGRLKDPIFQRYCLSLEPLRSSKHNRQASAQSALCELLNGLNSAILIGEGTGCQAAWLAADARPEKVAGIIAIEPAGPPFGLCQKKHPRRPWNSFYTPRVMFDKTVRRYGLTDIPLSFDPPLPKLNDMFDADLGDSIFPVVPHNTSSNRHWLQAPGYHGLEGEEEKGPIVRKLFQLQKTKHIVVTSHAGAHGLFDGATVAFMRQAGLEVEWIRLEHEGIYRNGHLMFLETNSDVIAARVDDWIREWDLF